MKEKGEYRRYARVGPGGWKCACCAPPPGPGKKAAVRQWKKAYNREIEKQVMKELEESGAKHLSNRTG